MVIGVNQIGGSQNAILVKAERLRDVSGKSNKKVKRRIPIASLGNSDDDSSINLGEI